MTSRFSGWHMTAILAGFFAVVIAVNVTMATFAARTFGGTVVENSYVASQQYNRWLADARRQDQLGWTIEPKLDGNRRVVVSNNVAGAHIAGFARHPLGRERDVRLSFTNARSDQALPAGRWAVHLLVQKNGDEARLIEVLQ